MLRFNLLILEGFFVEKKFQYILCYGSTVIIRRISIIKGEFQYILCYGSTVLGCRAI